MNLNSTGTIYAHRGSWFTDNSQNRDKAKRYRNYYCWDSSDTISTPPEIVQMCISYLIKKGVRLAKDEAAEIVVDGKRYVIALEKEVLYLIDTGWYFFYSSYKFSSRKG